MSYIEMGATLTRRTVKTPTPTGTGVARTAVNIDVSPGKQKTLTVKAPARLVPPKQVVVTLPNGDEVITPVPSTFPIGAVAIGGTALVLLIAALR